MAGRVLSLNNGVSLSLREVAARTTLREVHLEGHVYVELRQVGKRTIFFCTLCLTPCYSDSALFDHLRGSLHTKRHATAKVTLFGPLPWPFSDGVFFFGNSNGDRGGNLLVSAHPGRASAVGLLSRDGEDGKQLIVSAPSVSRRHGSCRLQSQKGVHSNAGFHAGGLHSIVAPGTEFPRNTGDSCLGTNGYGVHSRSNGNNAVVVMPGILSNNEVSTIRARFIGNGAIYRRVSGSSGSAQRKIRKIWCAWLGEGCLHEENVSVASTKCDFGVVILPYTYALGRKAGLDFSGYLLSSGSGSDVDDGDGSPGSSGKKPLPDTEDSSGAIIDPERGFTCGESSAANGDAIENRHPRRLMSSKAIRRELRKQKRLAAERMCDICRQPMLPGKDVGTLLNLNTGNLACSGRNTNGAFHLFHASCLIHWILLCESELWADVPANRRSTKRRKRKSAKSGRCIASVLCPECQGTGEDVVGDALEKPSIPLSEMFLYKMKSIVAHKEWMQNPELLQDFCSTGLQLSLNGTGDDDDDDDEEEMLPAMVMPFYRAEGERLPHV